MRRRWSRRWVGGVALAASATAALAVGAAGQTPPPPGVALPYPDGCAAYGLSEGRCAYIVRWAAEQAGADPAASTFELLGDPMPGALRTQAFVVRVRVDDGSGPPADESVFCGVGGGSSYLCTETPRIARRAPTGDTSGYWDVPCSDEEGQVCATPVPTAGASAIAGGIPLVVPSLPIPIDHTGRYEVVVGEASLPNGILTETSFDLAPTTPAELLVAEEGVTLRLESLDGGPPFENAYEHGWRPGVERVRATIDFDVESFAPGATLEVVDLVVR